MCKISNSMVIRKLMVFFIIRLVYSKCHEKGNSNLKLCDVTLNEDYNVQGSGSSLYIQRRTTDLTYMDLNRPLIQLGEQHYHFSTYLKVNYFNAFRFCSNLGMDLLSIESKEENDLIVDYMKKNYAGVKSFWTSGQDMGNPSDFVWFSNGKILSYSNWGEGKPDNSNNDEHCLLVSQEKGNYFWEDSNCWNRHFLVCEVVQCPYLC